MPSDLLHGFRVGPWTVAPLKGTIAGPDNKSCHLQPKVMDVLVCLAARADEPVTRDELLEEVWGENAVSDEPLTRAIGELRRALHDDRGHPKYIDTIPKRGYRLIGEVQPSTKSTAGGTGTRLLSRPALILGAVGLIAIAAISIAYLTTLNTQTPADAVLVEAINQSASRPKSVAVLPFINMSPDAGQDYFSDGISEEISNTLAMIKDLTVISRTSSFSFKGKDVPIPEIAETLDVAHILEGSVRKSGDRLRITAQLIDAQTDERLWADAYDRQLTTENVLAIQSEISREIAAALQVVLTDQENERLQTLPTTSLDAYREYLLGRQEASKRTAESLRRAQAHFDKAVELDAEYALAYVGLADSIALQVAYADLLESETNALRQAAIDKALALDPLSGEAYSSLAVLKMQKSEEAEEYFLKAIELSPNYANAYHLYAVYLRAVGRDEGALPHIRKAIELDPLEPVLTERLSRQLQYLGRVEEAQAALLKGIERNPEFAGFYRLEADLLNSVGRVGEAMRWVRAGISLGSRTTEIMWIECDEYLHLGDDQSSERCANSRAETSDEILYMTAMLNLHVFRSEYQEAVDLMEQVLRRNPVPRYKNNLAQGYLLNGEVDKARSIWQELLPDLYGDESVLVNPSELHLTILVAYTLYVDGELDRANYLFDQALEIMQSMHRTRGRGYFIWDAFIHATRGDKQKAISALRDAIDTGWRIDWWFYPRFPGFNSMREEPEWIELMSELEADITRQRQWYEEHKDDPLF